jgi:hypothetical protein
MAHERPREVVEALLAEFGELIAVVNRGASTPLMVKLYTRSIFSILDAYAFHLKQTAQVRSESRGASLDKKQLEMINEVRANSHGSARPKTIKTGENLRFAIRLYHRVMGGDPPPLGAELPPAFEHARKVRNRITHPKSRVDLEIEPQDATAMGEIFLWFKDITDWETRCELAYINELERESQRRNGELRRTIRPSGAVEPFTGTIEELYTAPTIEPKTNTC